MAANARAFGNGFNPISVFWCFDRDRALRRARSSRSTTPTAAGTPTSSTPTSAAAPGSTRRSTSRPFHGTDGWYDVAVPLPGDDLLIAITLHTDDGATFSASLSGRRTTDSALRAAPAAIRGAALIRMHGIWLWLRRLPVQPRPDDRSQEVR